MYVDHLRSANTLLTDKVVVLNSQITVLSDKLKTQNAAVDALKVAGDARLAQAALDLAAAKAEAAKHKGKSTIIYTEGPSVPGKSCDADRQSTLVLLNGGAK